MPINDYIDTVFAVDGDTTEIPDAADPGGAVSFAQGYPIGYQTPSGDPGSLPIERDKQNYLFGLYSRILQQYQQHGTPDFIVTTDPVLTVPYPYNKYDRVRYEGVVYWSLTDGNTDTPPSANWSIAQISNPIFIKMSAEPTAPAGHLPMDASTIALDSTNSPTFSGAVYQAAYLWCWNNYNNTASPVLPSGRGANALADWNAKKTIAIPDRRGYSPFGVKSGSPIASASDIAGSLQTSGSLSMSPITLSASNIPLITSTAITAAVDNLTNNRLASGDIGQGNAQTVSGCVTSDNTSGASFTPSGSFSPGTNSALQPSFGVYYYINYQ